jgi:hypothetical protein
MDHPTPLVRCANCTEPPAPGTTLRRGRCLRCYDAWVRARPVGIGASCAACENRRRAQLRYYEMGVRQNVPGGRWIILCWNCAALADSLTPPPPSVEALKMRIQRERRWGDRRAAAVGRPSIMDPERDRRRDERRVHDRNVIDATDLVEEIEMEADYDLRGIFDDVLDPDEVTNIHEVTGIHWKLPATD